jgi:hypothetical protein
MAKTSYFDKIQAKAFRAGVNPRSDESLKWFRKTLSSITRPSRTGLLKDSALKKVDKPLSGRMFMYFYDPKTKDTLPYYDRFPLIIMVKRTSDGFYGLNLHYLSPTLRAKFFDKLLDFKSNKKYNDSTRFRITYNFLKSSSKLKEFAPCFKRYLNSNVKSTIAEVPATEWEAALFLPTEQFVRKSKAIIWKASKELIY